MGNKPINVKGHGTFRGQSAVDAEQCCRSNTAVATVLQLVFKAKTSDWALTVATFVASGGQLQ